MFGGWGFTLEGSRDAEVWAASVGIHGLEQVQRSQGGRQAGGRAGGWALISFGAKQILACLVPAQHQKNERPPLDQEQTSEQRSV